MGKVEDYRTVLAGLDDWLPYLTAHSGLPGARANLELVAACGEVADRWRAEALVATGDEFATMCGLVAFGRLSTAGDANDAEVLRQHASDQRWRVREAVAMAVQRAGDDDLERAFDTAERWATDPDPLVRRAAVAAICEPRLLRDPAFARRALRLVEQVTAGLAELPPAERSDPSTRTLRQALGYGWSVAVAATPADGVIAFERLERSGDPDVVWIARENRKKRRLQRVLDP